MSNRKSLPPAGQIHQRSVQELTVSVGPIPSPAVLAEYHKLDATLINRIVSMAEQQATHRHTVEMKIVDASVFRSKAGMWMAFVLSVIGLGAASVGEVYGHATASAVIASVDLLALATVFISGRRAKVKQNEHRLSE